MCLTCFERTVWTLKILSGMSRYFVFFVISFIHRFATDFTSYIIILFVIFVTMIWEFLMWRINFSTFFAFKLTRSIVSYKGNFRIKKSFVYLEGKQFPIVFSLSDKTYCETLAVNIVISMRYCLHDTIHHSIPILSGL